MRQWTTKEVEFVKKHYSNEMTADIAKRINRTCTAVNHMAKRLGIKKSESYYLNLQT